MASPVRDGRPDVLIVGAGPVGLTVACELRLQGIDVRVVDRRDRGPSKGGTQSRAILIWPRILEQLRRIGVSDQLVEAGHVLPAVDYFSNGRLRGSVHIDRFTDTPYPFILTLAQDDTERILGARYQELGGVVERGTALEDIDDRGPTPLVRLRQADGGVEQVEPQWLVAADGAGSTTRELLGIPFDRDPIDISYAIGDFPISGPVPHSAQYYYSPTGIAVIVPLKDGLFRVAANVAHLDDDQRRPGKQLFEEVVAQRAKLPVRLGTPAWTSSFRPRCGVVREYRKGRCFLAGDAAHVVSPAGGQGMNLGLQDAVNLGWKLGGVIRGSLVPEVLDTYGSERSGAAKRVDRTSAAQIRLGTIRQPLKRAARDNLFAAAYRVGLLQRTMARLLAQTDFTYRAEASGGRRWRQARAVVGDRVPVFAGPPVAASLPSLDLHRLTVLAWPGRTMSPDWGDRVADLRLRLDGRVAVEDLSTTFGAPARTLRRVLGSDASFVVVRPDGHLAHWGDPGEPDRLMAFLASYVPSYPQPALAQLVG